MAGRIVEEAWSRNISKKSDGDSYFALMPSEGKTPLAWEYAKYKNRPTNFTVAVSSLSRSVELREQIRVGNREMTDHPLPAEAAAATPERKPLTPAAQRALAEAEARRQAAEAQAKPAAKEFQGPKGPEPTRYGDWETRGIASDF
jgi:hypothetical protein